MTTHEASAPSAEQNQLEQIYRASAALILRHPEVYAETRPVAYTQDCLEPIYTFQMHTGSSFGGAHIRTLAPEAACLLNTEQGMSGILYEPTKLRCATERDGYVLAQSHLTLTTASTPRSAQTDYHIRPLFEGADGTIIAEYQHYRECQATGRDRGPITTAEAEALLSIVRSLNTLDAVEPMDDLPELGGGLPEIDFLIPKRRSPSEWAADMFRNFFKLG